MTDAELAALEAAARAATQAATEPLQAVAAIGRRIAFRDLATPETWLWLIQRLREAEGRALKVRWSPSDWMKGGYDIDMGRVEIGIAFPSDAGWTIRMSFADIPTIFAPTEAAARSALEAAVREAMGHD
jgi:hypothetical protein